nr:proteoglycan 4 isoform X2 [Helicoverpa armigera]
MTLPPFPSQDLAKLVLGYLAEEQLMTAYDEFLQASPYLDALRNEYDRIFMTSLKNILAEYRAVKIYVETCKPLALRKKVVQCTNLLDVVKLLVNNIDISKIQAQDSSIEKNSLVKQNASGNSKQNDCEVCNTSSFSGCSCKNKQKSTFNSASYVEGSTLESSVETTALEDLPGNHVTTRKKHVKVLEKETSEATLGVSEITKQSSSVLNNSNSGLNMLNSNSHCSQIKPSGQSTHSLNSMTKPSENPECREKIEEFNKILNKVCKNKSQADTRVFSLSQQPELLNKSIPISFQDFASGVCVHENRNNPVPDSSTSETSIAMPSVASNQNTDLSNNLNDVSKSGDNLGFENYNQYRYPVIKPKGVDNKIKIISDVKVDQPFPAINNATSTPLMQTIVINGTPAYKHNHPPISNNYTKDEIMAMPTIIVVPASGPPPHLTQTKPVLTQKLQKTKTKPSTAKVLRPLVIDISSSSTGGPPKPSNESSNSIIQQNTQEPGLVKVVEPGLVKTVEPGLVKTVEPGLVRTVEPGLVKTVDVMKNASVPKDNVISGSLQTTTPQGMAPVRKSSSTPRRNSHIRVLDFTTPRRILHETINEVVPNEPNEVTENNPVEVVVTRSSHLVFPETGTSVNDIIDMSTVKVHKIETSQYNKLTNSNDGNPIPKKKSNWDADLRALIAMPQQDKPPPKSKAKPKKPKTIKPVIQPEQDKAPDKIEDKKPRSKRKLSPKPKKSKKKQKLEEEEEQSTVSTESSNSVKPTFNVVHVNRNTEPETTKPANAESHQNQNKSNNEEINDTPEAERLCLHNEIGARLNISEFLETPYKQVLYDIQMETPKFLGSVLPDEPISDIKIMSIPTPRFFDTPKPAIATPSSYSSRPTDYSSGGSYYKPDEQDYLRIVDVECPVTSSKEDPHVEESKDVVNDNKKSSRPVRKCTKNVSYVNSCATKTKVNDDKTDVASSCSDSTSANTSMESTQINVKTPKCSKIKVSSKSETKKKIESSKKLKISPMKKDKSNSFMKIKPRRLTPTKANTSKRTRRKTDVFSQNNTSKPQTKKKPTAKEKKVHITPVVNPAPTKSRRKSSTPRKLHCTKTFNSESSGHESPDTNAPAKHNIMPEPNTASVMSSHDSDNEQIALRWSDDGSQDAKPKETESEDITKIKQYIETSLNSKPELGTLQVDLIQRGFDAETAKIIERDLLDSPSIEVASQTQVVVTEPKKNDHASNKSVDPDASSTNELQIVQDAESDDEFELSVYECHEDSRNYIKCSSDAKDRGKEQPIKLKDKFTMEVCIDDGVAIRLRATDCTTLFSNDPDNEGELGYSFMETEVAVSSISNIDKLYTPMKDHKTQCYEIFDSTLTSLDTPLKVNSPSHKERTITEIEIVLEEEKVDTKDKADIKKRKRLQNSNSSEDGFNESKKTKPEASYLFNSTNIQNIDIESVLKKLHGP